MLLKLELGYTVLGEVLLDAAVPDGGVLVPSMVLNTRHGVLIDGATFVKCLQTKPVILVPLERENIINIIKSEL